MKFKLMVIDDEVLIRKTLVFAFEETYEVVTCESGAEALKAIGSEKPDLILLDLRLEQENGLEVLKRIKQLQPAIEVIMMTAYGSIDSSIEAMKLGAYHYLQKPLNLEEVRLLVHKALELVRAQRALIGIEGSLGLPYGLIGRSKAIEQVVNFIERSSKASSNVLITGESGTGKELVAKAVHHASRRASGPFVAVNCSAIPVELMESELFGHVKGAFTGAVEDRRGLIRLAEKGTLFFDEIGEMDLRLQSKLLRTLQEREIRPVGSNKDEAVDVRFIFATHRDLADEVRAGRFREDLYYRVNVLRIEIPPLRKRREDIPSLVDYFIRGLSFRDQLPMKTLTHQALCIIEQQDLTGNVRELQNLVERLMIYSDGPVIDVDVVNQCLETENGLRKTVNSGIFIPLESTMEEAEQLMIEKTLERFDGNRRRTAEALGIAERTLRYKIKKN
jgi:DNA-binding NtrC family response regulator